MAAKGLNGVAAKRMQALQRTLGTEPAKSSKSEHDAWRQLVVSRANALFAMVGKRVALVQLHEVQRDRLVELLGEAIAANKQLSSATAR